MPFKSRAQQRWMFAQHPAMAREFADATPDFKALPERAGDHATDASVFDDVPPGAHARVSDVPAAPHKAAAAPEITPARAAAGAPPALAGLYRAWDAHTKYAAGLTGGTAARPIVPTPGANDLHQMKAHTQAQMGNPNPKVLATPPTPPAQAGTAGMTPARPGMTARFNNPMPGAPNPLGAGSLAYGGMRSPGMGSGFKWAADGVPPVVAALNAPSRPPMPYGDSSGPLMKTYEAFGARPQAARSLASGLHGAASPRIPLVAASRAGGYPSNPAAVPASTAALLSRTVPHQTPPVVGGAGGSAYDERSRTIRLAGGPGPEDAMSLNAGASLRHEVEHARNLPDADALGRLPKAPGMSRSGSITGPLQQASEYAATLGDLPFTAQAHKLETGRLLNAPVAVAPGVTHDADWMARQAEQHGLFGGRSMADLLGTPSGQAYTRRLLDAQATGGFPKRSSDDEPLPLHEPAPDMAAVEGGECSPPKPHQTPAYRMVGGTRVRVVHGIQSHRNGRWSNEGRWSKGAGLPGAFGLGGGSAAPKPPGPATMAAKPATRSFTPAVPATGTPTARAIAGLQGPRPASDPAAAVTSLLPSSPAVTARKAVESTLAQRPQASAALADHLHGSGPRGDLVAAARAGGYPANPAAAPSSTVGLLGESKPRAMPPVDLTANAGGGGYNSQTGRIGLGDPRATRPSGGGLPWSSQRSMDAVALNRTAVLNHEVEHAYQLPHGAAGSGPVGMTQTAAPDPGRQARRLQSDSAEIPASLGDLPFAAEAYKRETGRPLNAPVTVAPGITHDADWMARQAQQHGYFGGRTMTELLATPSGQSYLKRLLDAQPAGIVKGGSAPAGLLKYAPAIIGAAETGVDTLAAGVNNPEHPGRAMGRGLATGLGTTGGILGGMALGARYGAKLHPALAGEAGEVAGGVLGAVGGGLAGTILGHYAFPDGEEEKEEKVAAGGLGNVVIQAARQLPRPGMAGAGAASGTSLGSTGAKALAMGPAAVATPRIAAPLPPKAPVAPQVAASPVVKTSVDASGVLGLGVLGGIGLAGTVGALSAPEGHRMEGAYRGVSRLGHVVGGAGVGALAGAGLGGGLGGQLASGASPEAGTAGMGLGAGIGALGGAAAGGLAANSLWDWTTPQPTWERGREQGQGGPLEEPAVASGHLKAGSFPQIRDPYAAQMPWQTIERRLRRAYSYLGKPRGGEQHKYTLDQAKAELEREGECCDCDDQKQAGAKKKRPAVLGTATKRTPEVAREFWAGVGSKKPAGPPSPLGRDFEPMDITPAVDEPPPVRVEADPMRRSQRRVGQR